VVTDIDISERQVERARKLVPGATFLVADMTRQTWERASFDAAVMLYSLIHVPLALQPSVIERVADCLVDDGILLATAGWDAWTGSHGDWLGSGAEMWWSQANQATYHVWLEAAGLEVVQSSFVPEDDIGHALFWARPRHRNGSSSRGATPSASRPAVLAAVPERRPLPALEGTRPSRSRGRYSRMIGGRSRLEG
jgi:SAM-dependent methyltransferase